MTGPQYAAKHQARTTVARVSGLLRHHPHTSMAAVLALSSPDQHATDSSTLVVGPVRDGADGVTRVSIAWSGFSGELRVTAYERGALLELEGAATGCGVSADTLAKVLRRLAGAAEAGSTSTDT